MGEGEVLRMCDWLVAAIKAKGGEIAEDRVLGLANGKCEVVFDIPDFDNNPVVVTVRSLWPIRLGPPALVI